MTSILFLSNVGTYPDGLVSGSERNKVLLLLSSANLILDVVGQAALFAPDCHLPRLPILGVFSDRKQWTVDGSNG